MTFSIVACSPDGRSWGVAVASRYFAVGAVVPGAEAGSGALATQSIANRAHLAQGLALLRIGLSASDTLEALVCADGDREDRQLGAVDVAGGAATFTGSRCEPWAGGRTGPGFAVQGNLLTGPDVVQQMVRAWQECAEEAPLGRRLFAALAAGDAAGGDQRGRQSAALLVVGPEAGGGQGLHIPLDLRVDDHRHPIGELGRLLDLGELYFGAPDPKAALPLVGDLGHEVDARIDHLGHSSLRQWMERENYERRFVDGGIDPVVLGRLRQATDGTRRR